MHHHKPICEQIITTTMTFKPMMKERTSSLYITKHHALLSLRECSYNSIASIYKSNTYKTIAVTIISNVNQFKSDLPDRWQVPFYRSFALICSLNALVKIYLQTLPSSLLLSVSWMNCFLLCSRGLNWNCAKSNDNKSWNCLS